MIATHTHKGPIPIQCDCCGQTLVAKIYGGKMNIKTKRFGKWHDTYLTLDQIIELFDREKTNKLDSKHDG